MDSNGDEFLNSLQNCKRLHLVRHAQGIHNVEAEKNKEATLSPRLFDAKLSQKGWQQVGEGRKQVRENGLLERVELVVTSPMQRTMQTAVGIFFEDEFKDTNGPSELLSTAKCPPIIAVELCRERMGLNPCDKRGSINKYRSLFPMIDFTLIESDDDVLWDPNRREELEQVAARGLQFLKWLRMRPEKEIAIVSHGIFLQETLVSAFGNKIGVPLNDKLFTRFANCELRTVLIDERAIISDSLRTSYCREIPCGIDFPQEASKETVLAKEMSS